MNILSALVEQFYLLKEWASKRLTTVVNRPLRVKEPADLPSALDKSLYLANFQNETVNRREHRYRAYIRAGGGPNPWGIRRA